MEQPFILDQVRPEVVRPEGRKLAAFIKEGMGAKRFLVNHDMAVKLIDLFQGEPDLYLEQRRFAKPPFDKVYVEYRVEDNLAIAGHGYHGILIQDQKVVWLSATDGEEIKAGTSYALIEESGIRVKDWTEEGDSPEAKEFLVMFVAMTEILWLLMHRPGMVKTLSVPGKQKVVKGKLRPVRAHSVLTIDLAAKDIARSVMSDGRKGSGVREHQVRGTWVHYHLPPARCAHDWQKVDREVWKPERFYCPKCEAFRSWRRDHVRGEHSRGNKFHTYEVKDSRLETRH
jgi:hypothetical protein